MNKRKGKEDNLHIIIKKIRDAKEEEIYKVYWYDIKGHTWESSEDDDKLLATCWTIGRISLGYQDQRKVIIIII